MTDIQEPFEDAEDGIEVDLKDKHREVCRLVAAGYTNKEINEIVSKASLRTITRVRNSEKGKEFIAKLRKGRDRAAGDLSQRVKLLNDRALKYMERALTDKDVPHDVRFRASKWVLEVSGCVPKKEPDKTNGLPPITILVEKMEAQLKLGGGDGAKTIESRTGQLPHHVGDDRGQDSTSLSPPN